MGSLRSLLPVRVHVFVILHVVAGGDVVHPVLVVEVPADGLLDALLELERRLPAQLALQLGGIDGVAHVVAGAVRDIGDQIHVGALGTAQHPVHRVDQHLDDVDVLPLVEAADVVGVAHLALVEDEVDGAGVILDIEPVAHVLALAIDRQRLAVTDIVDEQGDELLWELVRTVVVRAVGDHGGHPVGVVEGPHEVVAGGLGGAVGTVGLVFEVLGEELLAVGQMVLAGGGLRGEGGLDAVGVGHLQGAIDLIGGDVVEALAFPLLGEGLPVELRGLQEGEGAHHVGLCEGEGVLDGAVHMALGGEMDDAVDMLVLHQLVNALEVADVHLDELVVGLALDILEVGEVTGIGEFVDVDDVVFGVLVYEQPYHMAANESGSAGDDDVHLG